MKVVNTYTQFINEQIQVEPLLAGKEGFKIFFDLVNKHGNDFAFQNYLNTGSFYYFFSTDRITKINELLGELEMKKSLETAFLTLRSIKDDKLSFFIGIKNKILEYGFYNSIKNLVYKIGKFKINDRFLRYDFPRHQCVKSIKLRLKDSNLKNLNLLHQVKKDFVDWWSNVKSEVKILDELRISKTMSLDLFKEDHKDETLLNQSLIHFAQDKSWIEKVTPYTNVDKENNEVKFFFRIIEEQITFFNFDPHL